MDIQNVRMEISAIQLHRKCYDPAQLGENGSNVNPNFGRFSFQKRKFT